MGEANRKEAAARAAVLEELPPAVRELLMTPTSMTALPGYLNSAAGIHIMQVEARGEFCKGHLNIYTCEACRGHMVTRDLDTGVTPFMTLCKVTEGCKGMMRSSFYRVSDQRMRASHVWYRPPILPDAATPNMIEHLTHGGLLLREARPDEEV